MSDVELERGEAIGVYVIDGKLGAGGMGSVYLGVHSVNGKKVAIKVVRVRRRAAGLDTADEEDLAKANEALLRESRILALIESPNIVEVFDCGIRAEDGTVWIAMRYLQGRSLRHVIQRFKKAGKKMSLEQKGRWLYQLFLAIAELHAAGVIHRDLKPENVMIEADGRAVLIDLGIAYAKSKRATTTEPGKVKGTPAYMAPEQVTGAARTDRVDVYQLGVLAYELLSDGHHPHVLPEEEERGVDTLELWGRHVHMQPIPMREFGVEIAPVLERWTLSLLGKRWEDRPIAAEAAAELQRVLSSLGVDLPVVRVGLKHHMPDDPEDVTYTHNRTEEQKGFAPARVPQVVVRDAIPVTEPPPKLPKTTIRMQPVQGPPPGSPMPSVVEAVSAAYSPSPAVAQSVSSRPDAVDTRPERSPRAPGAAPPVEVRGRLPSAPHIVPRTIEMPVVEPSTPPGGFASVDSTPRSFSTPARGQDRARSRLPFAALLIGIGAAGVTGAWIFAKRDAREPEASLNVEGTGAQPESALPKTAIVTADPVAKVAPPSSPGGAEVKRSLAPTALPAAAASASVAKPQPSASARAAAVVNNDNDGLILGGPKPAPKPKTPAPKPTYDPSKKYHGDDF